MSAAMEPDGQLRPWLLTLCDLLLGLVFCAGCVANTLVLLVFYRKAGLRTIANRFVVNLMVVNILSCASLVPLAIVDAEPIPPWVVCLLGEFSAVFCSTGMVLAVLLIAVDQYFAVVDPLHYHYIISGCRSSCMILSAWCLSALLSVLAVVQPPGGDSIFRSCSQASNESSEAGEAGEAGGAEPGLYRLLFSAGFVSLVFLVPFVLICFIYCRICAAASGNSKRTRQNGSSTFSNEEFVIAPLTEARAAEDPCCYVIEKPEARPAAARPSFVLTRPSPPRTECADTDPAGIKSNSSLPNLKIVRIESEVPLLKPTLKSNSSFSKLTALHIQFNTEGQKERRHSNVPLTAVDPEFEHLPKSRSPSIQSGTFELPSRSSSTRSTITSQGKSSRSSSIYSTLGRPAVSRASSIRSTSSYIVHNIRHRISNASLFRYREEARAARISAMVIVMALLCWLPFFAVFCLRLDRFTLHPFPHYLDSFSIALLLLSTVASPCLFAFRNRKIKKEIRKLFGLRKNDFTSDCSKSFYRHNFSLDLKSHTAELLFGLKKKTQEQQTGLH